MSGREWASDPPSGAAFAFRRPAYTLTALTASYWTSAASSAAIMAGA
jgi:hypothetical protein